MSPASDTRAALAEANRVCREVLRELETARGVEVFGGVADLIDATRVLVRAVRAHLHTSKSDGG